MRSNVKTAARSDIPAMNRTIDRYNTVAIALYTVAAATGITWLALKLSSPKTGDGETILLPIVSPTELSLGVTGRWGN